MTPLEYATLCASRYPSRPHMIKGRGHQPRIAIDKKNQFHKILKKAQLTAKVTVRDEHGAYVTRWMVEEAIFRFYADDLAAAGIDTTTGEIISEPHWLSAQAVLRLTGAPFDHEATFRLAAEVRAQVEARADQEMTQALLDQRL